ncbi:MAG: 1-deoxy-D-xylulose-5-phosphate synthase [Gammaproteobacteria bacterium]|nr:MAG: 1-deoxy-D-xylulose-5-phosphate synthase [Gammaproteobacteria bacterium]
MVNAKRYPQLARINSPADLRKLPEDRLASVSDEIRDYLIQTMSHTGGHFAANLGTIELATALHYAFETPHDRIVWDVGHQAYPHKILTGRRDQLSSIRQLEGLAPFPSRAESEYDTFGVGHSSTSVSAALGMAIAAASRDESRRVVAVIGDGAMTAGLAYEALNHAGSLNVDLLVILNDNDMSISENVGAMSNYLAKILSGKLYSTIREGSKNLIRRMPTVWELARRSEEHVKGMVLPGTLFEELGLNYIGPIDGHDMDALLSTLRNLRDLKGPQFLHVMTRKGKGYEPAEADPIKWHGPGPFDPEKGELIKKKSGGPSYSKVFGDWLIDMAEADERIVGITPAMREGSGMVDFEKRFPNRYFDVGIAEQHSVTLGAGLACEGMRPVVAIYSTFLQRAYDQLIHDVALQNLPVVFAIDRGGLVGADGPTHHGAFDLSYLRCVPNMVVMAPADENECRQMLYTGVTLDQPSAIRYPRGTGPGVQIDRQMKELPVGKAKICREGTQVALLAFGAMVPTARIVGDTLDATVVNMRFIKPLDEDLLLRLAGSHRALVTIEDNAVAGGAGSGVNECLARLGVASPVLNLGIPDRFIEHGSREQCLSAAGLDHESVLRAIRTWLGETTRFHAGHSA